MTRVYLPAAPGLVREWLTGRAVPEGTPGWAVTPAVEAAMADSDTEELEYAVMLAAAESSLALLTAADPPRRMVLAVDGEVEPVDGDSGQVRLVRAVRWRDVASLHVDAADAEAVVRAAAETAEGGLTDDLRERLDRHELEWFAAQEIADALSALVTSRAGGDV